MADAKFTFDLDLTQFSRNHQKLIDQLNDIGIKVSDLAGATIRVNRAGDDFISTLSGMTAKGRAFAATFAEIFDATTNTTSIELITAKESATLEERKRKLREAADAQIRQAKEITAALDAEIRNRLKASDQGSIQEIRRLQDARDNVVALFQDPALERAIAGSLGALTTGLINNFGQLTRAGKNLVDVLIGSFQAGEALPLRMNENLLTVLESLQRLGQAAQGVGEKQRAAAAKIQKEQDKEAEKLGKLFVAQVQYETRATRASAIITAANLKIVDSLDDVRLKAVNVGLVQGDTTPIKKAEASIRAFAAESKENFKAVAAVIRGTQDQLPAGYAKNVQGALLQFDKLVAAYKNVEKQGDAFTKSEEQNAERRAKKFDKILATLDSAELAGKIRQQLPKELPGFRPEILSKQQNLSIEIAISAFERFAAASGENLAKARAIFDAFVIGAHSGFEQIDAAGGKAFKAVIAEAQRAAASIKKQEDAVEGIIQKDLKLEQAALRQQRLDKIAAGFRELYIEKLDKERAQRLINKEISRESSEAEVARARLAVKALDEFAKANRKNQKDLRRAAADIEAGLVDPIKGSTKKAEQLLLELQAAYRALGAAATSEAKKTADARIAEEKRAIKNIVAGRQAEEISKNIGSRTLAPPILAGAALPEGAAKILEDAKVKAAAFFDKYKNGLELIERVERRISEDRLDKLSREEQKALQVIRAQEEAHRKVNRLFLSQLRERITSHEMERKKIEQKAKDAEKLIEVEKRVAETRDTLRVLTGLPTTPLKPGVGGLTAEDISRINEIESKILKLVRTSEEGAGQVFTALVKIAADNRQTAGTAIDAIVKDLDKLIDKVKEVDNRSAEEAKKERANREAIITKLEQKQARAELAITRKQDEESQKRIQIARRESIAREVLSAVRATAISPSSLGEFKPSDKESITAKQASIEVEKIIKSTDLAKGRILQILFEIVSGAGIVYSGVEAEVAKRLENAIAKHHQLGNEAAQAFRKTEEAAAKAANEESKYHKRVQDDVENSVRAQRHLLEVRELLTATNRLQPGFDKPANAVEEQRVSAADAALQKLIKQHFNARQVIKLILDGQIDQARKQYSQLVPIVQKVLNDVTTAYRNQGKEAADIAAKAAAKEEKERVDANKKTNARVLKDIDAFNKEKAARLKSERRFDLGTSLSGTLDAIGIKKGLGPLTQVLDKIPEAAKAALLKAKAQFAEFGAGLERPKQQLRAAVKAIKSNMTDGLSETEEKLRQLLQNVITQYKRAAETITKNEEIEAEKRRKLVEMEAEKQARIFRSRAADQEILKAAPRLGISPITAEQREALRRTNDEFKFLVKNAKIESARLIEIFDAVRQKRNIAFQSEAERRLTRELQRLIKGYDKIREAADLAAKAQTSALDARKVKSAIANALGALNTTARPAQVASLQVAFNELEGQMIKLGISSKRVVALFQQMRDGTVQATTSAERTILKNLRNIIAAHDQASRATNSFLQGFAINWTSLGRLVAIQAVHRQVALVTNALREGARQVIEFEKTISLLQGLTQDINQGNREWAQTLRDIADEFGGDLGELAKATYEAVSNQIVQTTADARIFGEEITKLARVTASSIDESGKLVAGLLNSYQLGIGSLNQVNAQLFSAIDLGKFKIEEIAEQLGRAAPQANQLGISMSELLGGLATLTIEGRKANASITLLRNIMLKLLKPGEELQAFFEDLGFATGRAAVQSLGFTNILQRLTQVSPENLAKMFSDLRAVEGILSLTSNSFERFAENTRIIGQESGEQFRRAFEITEENPLLELQRELTRVKTFFTDDIGRAIAETLQDINEGFGGFSNRIKDVKVLLEDSFSVGVLQKFGEAINGIGKQTGLNEVNVEARNLLEVLVSLGEAFLLLRATATIGNLAKDFKAARAAAAELAAFNTSIAASSSTIAQAAQTNVVAESFRAQQAAVLNSRAYKALNASLLLAENTAIGTYRAIGKAYSAAATGIQRLRSSLNNLSDTSKSIVALLAVTVIIESLKSLQRAFAETEEAGRKAFDRLAKYRELLGEEITKQSLRETEIQVAELRKAQVRVLEYFERQRRSAEDNQKQLGEAAKELTDQLGAQLDNRVKDFEAYIKSISDELKKLDTIIRKAHEQIIQLNDETVRSQFELAKRLAQVNDQIAASGFQQERQRLEQLIKDADTSIKSAEDRIKQLVTSRDTFDPFEGLAEQSETFDRLIAKAEELANKARIPAVAGQVGRFAEDADALFSEATKNLDDAQKNLVERIKQLRGEAATLREGKPEGDTATARLQARQKLRDQAVAKDEEARQLLDELNNLESRRVAIINQQIEAQTQLQNAKRQEQQEAQARIDEIREQELSFQREADKLTQDRIRALGQLASQAVGAKDIDTASKLLQEQSQLVQELQQVRIGDLQTAKQAEDLDAAQKALDAINALEAQRANIQQARINIEKQRIDIAKSDEENLKSLQDKAVTGLQRIQQIVKATRQIKLVDKDGNLADLDVIRTTFQDVFNQIGTIVTNSTLTPKVDLEQFERLKELQADILTDFDEFGRRVDLSQLLNRGLEFLRTSLKDIKDKGVIPFRKELEALGVSAEALDTASVGKVASELQSIFASAQSQLAKQRNDLPALINALNDATADLTATRTDAVAKVRNVFGENVINNIARVFGAESFQAREGRALASNLSGAASRVAEASRSLAEADKLFSQTADAVGALNTAGVDSKITQQLVNMGKALEAGRLSGQEFANNIKNLVSQSPELANILQPLIAQADKVGDITGLEEFKKLGEDSIAELNRIAKAVRDFREDPSLSEAAKAIFQPADIQKAGDAIAELRDKLISQIAAAQKLNESQVQGDLLEAQIARFTELNSLISRRAEQENEQLVAIRSQNESLEYQLELREKLQRSILGIESSTNAQVQPVVPIRPVDNNASNSVQNIEQTINLNVNGVTDPRAVAKIIIPELQRAARLKTTGIPFSE